MPAPASFDEASDSRFHIEIYAEEWGYFFCHHGRASWIRVTDVAFVHIRDDYQMLGETPALSAIGTLLRAVEARHGLAFRREHAFVSTNLVSAEPAIRAWIQSL